MGRRFRIRPRATPLGPPTAWTGYQRSPLGPPDTWKPYHRSMASRFTHIALPCRDLEFTIAWYEAHTPMRAFHRRSNDVGEVAWLAAEGSSTTLVLTQSFAARDAGEPLPTLAPFAHLGFSVEDPSEVEAIAEAGLRAGCLAWEPAHHQPPVGYLCALSDPDGNLVEFSHGQEL